MKSLLTLIILLSMCSCVSLSSKQKIVKRKPKFKTKRQLRNDCFNNKFKYLGLNHNEAIEACKYILNK